MNTCRLCRWWACNVNGKPRLGNVFACLCPEVNRPAFELANEPRNAGPDEGGHFLTGPEFGCVHWQDSTVGGE